MRREKTSAAGILGRRRVPAERKGRTRNGLIAGEELLDDRRGKKRVAAGETFPEPEQKTMDVLGIGEKPGVSSDAAHRVRVVVVHFAADDALAPRTVLGGRDHFLNRLEAPRPQLRKIDERGRAQPDGSVNFIETIAVERPAGDFLDRLAE